MTDKTISNVLNEWVELLKEEREQENMFVKKIIRYRGIEEICESNEITKSQLEYIVDKGKIFINMNLFQ